MEPASSSAMVPAARVTEAAGMSSVRAGFCYSPDYDALFALGWPHIRFVADGHRDDEDAPGNALRLLIQGDPPSRFVWPRGVAQSLVRIWGLPSIFELAPGVHDVRLEAEEAAWRPHPITGDEAHTLVAGRMGQDVPGISDRSVESFVLLLEALVGPETVGSAILDALEQMGPDLLLAEWTLPPYVTWHLGFLLLRVPAAVAASWRVRLTKLLESVWTARPKLQRTGFRGAGGSHARSIHLVLNGALAAENSTDRSLRWYAHVVDDPVLVRMRVAVNRLAYEPDARLVWLGGPDVLERYARDWSKLQGSEAQRWFFEQIAPIRSPAMFPLVLELAGRSLVRDEATAWFVAHASDAKGFLADAAASDGTAAAYARRVQAAIAQAS